MIPAVGIPTLPWAIRPGLLRPQARKPGKTFRRYEPNHKPIVVFGFYAFVLIAALRLQCACWRSQAEHWLCPTPPPPPDCSP